MGSIASEGPNNGQGELPGAPYASKKQGPNKIHTIQLMKAVDRFD
jgi:hypothetical protein